MIKSKIKKARSHYTGPLQAATSTGKRLNGNDNGNTCANLSRLAGLMLKRAGLPTIHKGGLVYSTFKGKELNVSGLTMAMLIARLADHKQWVEMQTPRQGGESIRQSIEKYKAVK